MARPQKEGLDYFPLDTVFDEKVVALELLHKNDGLVWIIKFWQKAYNTNNGEVNLNGIFGVIQAENCRITIGKHQEIIKSCLELGLLIEINNGIYTSNGIQKRLDKVVKDRQSDRKRKFSDGFPGVFQVENVRKRGESKEKEKVNKTINTYVDLAIDKSVSSHKKQPNHQITHEFEAIWARYPKRDGKKAAIKHYNSTVKTEIDRININKALDNYINHIKTNHIQPQFIKNGSTWFNNWRDWLEIATNAPKTEFGGTVWK